MQSAVPHVLAVLDRVHAPDRPVQAVAEARAAGFADISLDLIYGTPGESLADWATSLDAAIAAEPEHLSAYALIVEDGTKLAARIRRGELPPPDDDDLADKYLLADERLTAAGLSAYEVSNWAAGRRHRCRHNLGYWRGDHWWGIGPGAHSHVGGVRWWNVKHPTRVRRAARDRDVAGVRPGGADPGSAPDGTGAAGVAARRRPRPRRTHARRSATGCRTWWPAGWSSSTPDALVLTRAGRLLADGISRDLLDDLG